MLRDRLIFVLFYSDGYFVQSRNFKLQRVGDLDWLRKNYNFFEISKSIDELFIVNISRGESDAEQFCNTVQSIIEKVHMPVCVGGGIASKEIVKRFFLSGADKIVVNTALYTNPKLISYLCEKYGSQAVVGSIDYRYSGGEINTFSRQGSVELNQNLKQSLDYVSQLGPGEIILNCIDRDGTGFGYDLNNLKLISADVSVPLIALGGAGKASHFLDALNYDRFRAVATGNLFNFLGDALPLSRKWLLENDANLASWSVNSCS